MDPINACFPIRVACFATPSKVLPVVVKSGHEILSIIPNPAHSAFEISFINLSAESVELKIYDMTGREVQSIVNSKAESGHYTFGIDISAQPAGVYYARINAGQTLETIKLVLVK